MSSLRYNRVPESYWKLSAGWGDRLQKLGLYVQTCTHRTGEGLYNLPIAYAAHDLEWTPQQTRRLLKQLAGTGFIAWDAATEVLLLHNALEIQAPQTENQIKGAVEKLRRVPPSPLLSELYGHALVHSNGFADSIRMAFPNALAWIDDSHSNGIAPRMAMDSDFHSNSPSLSPTTEG